VDSLFSVGISLASFLHSDAFRIRRAEDVQFSAAFRPPLKDVIHAAETADLDTVVGKVYVRTEEKDDQGRVVCAEQ